MHANLVITIVAKVVELADHPVKIDFEGDPVDLLILPG
jgi:hypothetical protein